MGVRLLQRTTRSLNLTIEGKAYYERISVLLREFEEADDALISGGKPQEKLTISTSVDFGQWLLVQSIPEFLRQYPEIEIDLRLSDRLVDKSCIQNKLFIAHQVELMSAIIHLRLGDTVRGRYIHWHRGIFPFY